MHFLYMIINKYSAIVVSLISAGLLFTSPALAARAPSWATNGPAQASSQADIAKQNVQTRLQDAKLKACQAREAGITNRSVHLGQLVTTMEVKFDTIATRVEEYYTTKVVPGGKTVANYDSLVADTQTKKATVQVAVTKAQADVAGFSCTGENPKGQMMTFRVDMQGVKQALKDYRTSIKDLIVAVRSKSPNPGGNRP